jgi:hypothetical protein
MIIYNVIYIYGRGCVLISLNLSDRLYAIILKDYKHLLAPANCRTRIYCVYIRALP